MANASMAAVSSSPSTQTSPPTIKSILSCEVHPLFASENWIGITKEEYKSLLPALRLATMFLTKPACLGFWATLLFSPRRLEKDARFGLESNGTPYMKADIESDMDPKDVSDFSLPGRYIAKSEESALTAYKVQEVIDMFHELGGLYKFYFRPMYAIGETWHDTWRDLAGSEKDELKWQQEKAACSMCSARMNIKHDKTVDQIEAEEKEFYFTEAVELVRKAREKERAEHDFSTPCIPGGFLANWDGHDSVQDPRTRMSRCTFALNSDILRYIKPNDPDEKDPLAFAYMFASLLLHELAHAVEMGRPERRLGGYIGGLKTVFPGETLGEEGHQLEKALFGDGHCDFNVWQLSVLD